MSEKYCVFYIRHGEYSWEMGIRPKSLILACEKEIHRYISQGQYFHTLKEKDGYNS